KSLTKIIFQLFHIHSWKMHKLMNQKEIVKTFLHAVAFGRVKEGYDKYVSPHFIHHNPYFPGDRQSLMTAMEEAHLSEPNTAFEILKIAEDGDTVFTYSRVEKKSVQIAVSHIFRFEDDKIAEMWDIGHVIDPGSPNKNGMF